MFESAPDRKLIRLLSFYLFILSATLYVFSFSANYYSNDSAMLRGEVVRSLMERRDVSITPDIGLTGRDGRAYSWLGIGSALLSVPFYVLGDAVGIPPENAIMFINPFFGAATVVLVFFTCLSLGYRKNISLRVALIYCAATMAWPYAKHPFDHVLETFFILLSLFALHEYGIGSKPVMLATSVVSIGIAFLVRPTSALAIPALLAGLLAMYLKNHDFRESIRRTGVGAAGFTAGLLPFASLFLWYNWYCFGSVFSTGYSVIAERTGIDFFSGTPLSTGLAGLLVSPGKGYFFYTPVAAMAFIPLRSFMKKHCSFFVFSVSFILLYLLFLSKNVCWHGDWAWGPRYIFAITPFLVIPLAELFSSPSWETRRMFRACTLFVITISVAIQITAVSVDFQKYFFHMKNEEHVDFVVIREAGMQPIVELPAVAYFDWRKSAIPHQIRFVWDLMRGVKGDQYTTSPVGGGVSREHVRRLNAFDFWWINPPGFAKTNIGLVVGLACMIVIGYCGFRLYRHV